VSRPRVFVTRRIAESALQKLSASATVELFDGPTPPSPDVVLQKIRGCDAVLSMLTERIDARVLDAAPGLKVVSNMAVGVDNVEADAWV